MATKTAKGDGARRDLVGQLKETAKQARDRINEYLAEARVRQRLADAVDAINDVGLAVLRRIRGEPAAKPSEKTTARASKPLEQMTVRELHELASERRVPGRSSMSKSELIDALRKD